MTSTTGEDRQSNQGAVSAAAALRPLILEARTETEEGRKLPDTVVDALKEAEMFQVALPKEMGGLALSPVELLEILEDLAKAEASVAWIVWNNALPCLFARFLGSEARKRVFGDPQSIYASSTRPSGKAVVENGGYRVSGRWALVSGCMHADWIELMCVVEKDGEIQMNKAGMPQMLLACVPKGSYEIIDTWHVGGLRGTGSHDVVVENINVDEALTFSPFTPGQIEEPIGKVPVVCNMAAGHAAICLGICQASIDAVAELGRTKISVDPVPDMRDKPDIQYALASADAQISALRDRLHRVTSMIWEKTLAGETATAEDIAVAWATANTTARECRAIVTRMYEAAGTSALYTDNVLERCHRDIHAVMQHIIAQRQWVENAGRTMFGLEPTHPLFLV